MLNRLNLEHIRLQKRSDFELELAENLTKYIDEYHRIWAALWEGGTSYIEDMKERIEQQMRYSRQVQRDLLILPRRIKNQSKAVRSDLPFVLWSRLTRSVDFKSHYSERQQAQHSTGGEQ